MDYNYWKMLQRMSPEGRKMMSGDTSAAHEQAAQEERNYDEWLQLHNDISPRARTILMGDDPDWGQLLLKLSPNAVRVIQGQPMRKK